MMRMAGSPERGVRLARSCAVRGLAPSQSAARLVADRSVIRSAVWYTGIVHSESFCTQKSSRKHRLVPEERLMQHEPTP
jgi:hypothetical protein